MSDLEKTILKWLAVLIALPFVWPFLKALWEELNKALREDGGVFGRAPLPRELDELRREAAGEEDPLVKETRFKGAGGGNVRRFRDSGRAGEAGEAKGRSSSGAGRRRGRVEGGRRPGFR